MTRVILGGGELEGFSIDQPAASVRLLLPTESELVVPGWNGNEFLLADGRRPIIRTFTPRHVDPEKGDMDLDVVLHDGGAVSSWVRVAEAGDPAAVSGPGRGYVVDPDASSFLLIGDETAIPAISQLLETVPTDVRVGVIVEIAHPDAKLDLPEHPRAAVQWCDRSSATPPGSALVSAVRAASLPTRVSVWAAGEAAAMHAIRRHLFEDRGLARSQATVRGYWKHGRRNQSADDA